jgi:hypothetical protein
LLIKISITKRRQPLKNKNNLSRRDFLKLTWASLWGLVLAACKIELDEETPTPTATNTPMPEPQKDSAPVVEEEPTPTNTPTETPIPCFKLLTPENEVWLPAIGKVTFSWEPMPGAESYKIEITLPNKQVIFFETKESSRDQYLEAIKMDGLFEWLVIAYDPAGNVICTTEPFTFEKEKAPASSSGGNSGNNDATTTTTTTTTSDIDE